MGGSEYFQSLKIYKKSLFCRFGLRKHGENTFDNLQKVAFKAKGAKGDRKALHIWTPPLLKNSTPHGMI